MGLKEFAIVLDDPKDGVYCAGDTLCGKVIITLENGKNEQYETLRIIVSGQASNSWFEKTNHSMKSVEILEEEEYINFEAEMSIEASTNMEKAEYGFEYELSEGLPSSFLGGYGKISYAIKAILEGTTQKTEAVKDFVVQGHLDLNQVPDAAQSVNINLTQPLLFQNGHLGMEAKLTKSGFIPGENVPIYSKLTNGSDKMVNVSLFLVKETIYYAQDRKVTDSEIIATVNGPRLKPQETEVWSGDLIQIPALPFNFLQNCRIINICYRLVIEIEIPIPNINLEGTIPIVIGTTSLVEVVRTTNKAKKTTNALSGSVTPTVPSSRTNEKRGGGRIRPRQKRPMTTCLVFRPEKPRQNLPTPKPETWSRALKIPGIEASAAPLENDLENVDDVASDMLVLNKNKESDAEKLPPFFAPPFPGKKSNQNERRKWPEGYIRKREVQREFPGNSTNRNTENKSPPPKPARLKESLIQNNGDNGILPYPKENSENFPLPDFSFNVSVNGQRKQPIGWNVTRNTLTLKRAKVAAGFVLPLPTVGWSADPEIK